ncbi:MAG: DUF167 domain-containing protein [Bryobacterales bacterium]|nr:DUF167 domain-containing protein [Bryobacterales bacterium]
MPNRPKSSAGSQTIQITVSPRAAVNRILKTSLADGAPGYRIWVTAPPEGGKANKDAIRLLADELGVPRSSLAVIRGLTGRRKTVRVVVSKDG